MTQFTFTARQILFSDYPNEAIEVHFVVEAEIDRKTHAVQIKRLSTRVAFGEQETPLTPKVLPNEKYAEGYIFMCRLRSAGARAYHKIETRNLQTATVNLQADNK